MKKPLLALLLTAATLAAAPSSAHAGSYVLVGCADLAGALGPTHVVRPTEGWFLEQGVDARQDCAAGRRGLGLFTKGSTYPSIFRLDAPAHTRIARFVLTYRVHLSGANAWAIPTFVVQAGHGDGWEYILPAYGHLGADPIDFGGDRVVADTHGADALRIGTRCDLAGPCYAGGEPAARFHALAVVLSDDRAPRAAVTAPGGHVRGTVDLSLAATDEGGGVYERSLLVDGRRVAGAVLCPTVPASAGPMRHVVRRVPCPLDAPRRASLDTLTLADGTHTILGRVEDVAGNLRTDHASILVDNRPPSRGTVELMGEAAASEALTAAPNGFSGQDVAYEYRWQRCDAHGEACREIGGAIERAYALRAGDVGRRVRAVVTASDGGGGVQVSSAASAIVTGQGTGPGGVSVAAPAGSAPPDRLTAWLERGSRRLRSTTVRWPARVRIRGRLTDRARRPLPRATVRMRERVDGHGWRSIASLRTRRDGRLTSFTKTGPSRRLRLIFGRTSVTLRLRVRASARVSVRRSGAQTRVTGRLLGGRVPPLGVRVRLQSRRGAAWSTRAVLRTDALGRFAASGRAPAGVPLRISIPAQRGYPFARGVARP
jgi:hypothetical protein